MKKLSLNRNKTSKKQNESQPKQQSKISSFFVFKTPEQAAKKEEDEANDMIENTPEAEEEVINKKRKLFKLKKHGSRVGGLLGLMTEQLASRSDVLDHLPKTTTTTTGGLFAKSTTSLIAAGNLDKKATKVYSPPPMPRGLVQLRNQLSFHLEEAKKRPLSPDNT